MSVTNRHSANNFDLIKDTNRVNVSVGQKAMTMDYLVKGKRRTVNAVPKLDRSGNENPKYKVRRNNKTFCFSTGQIHDKNAMNRFSGVCNLSKRITKLHRANKMAAKRAASAK